MDPLAIVTMIIDTADMEGIISAVLTAQGTRPLKAVRVWLEHLIPANATRCHAEPMCTLMDRWLSVHTVKLICTTLNLFVYHMHVQPPLLWCKSQKPAFIEIIPSHCRSQVNPNTKTFGNAKIIDQG